MELLRAAADVGKENFALYDIMRFLLIYIIYKYDAQRFHQNPVLNRFSSTDDPPPPLPVRIRRIFHVNYYPDLKILYKIQLS